MKPMDAINHFGSQRKLAEALSIHEANVSRWKDVGIIPLRRALELSKMTDGELDLKLSDYR